MLGINRLPKISKDCACFLSVVHLVPGVDALTWPGNPLLGPSCWDDLTVAPWWHFPASRSSLNVCALSLLQNTFTALRDRKFLKQTVSSRSCGKATLVLTASCSFRALSSSRAQNWGPPRNSGFQQRVGQAGPSCPHTGCF
jgi:hypothetical protein